MYNANGTKPAVDALGNSTQTATYVFTVNVDSSGNYKLNLQHDNPNAANYAAPATYLVGYSATDNAGNSTAVTSYTAQIKTAANCLTQNPTKSATNPVVLNIPNLVKNTVRTGGFTSSQVINVIIYVLLLITTASGSFVFWMKSKKMRG